LTDGDDPELYKGENLSVNFNSSRLVRLLGESTVVAMEPSRQDVAQRLSLWLSAVDTFTLHEVLQSINVAAPASPPDAQRAGHLGVEDECRQVRAALVDAITADPAARTSDRRLHDPRPVLAAPETAADYAPHHKRYLDLQRQMESKIGPLRARVRLALSRVSPRLKQLATLDALMEQTLGGREQKLLSTVPVFLERRFEHLRKSQTQDDPASWRQAGGWLHGFGQELHAVLLAELDVRWQPVMGLMDAFTNEVKKHQ
jgi:hypothetical protein